MFPSNTAPTYPKCGITELNCVKPFRVDPAKHPFVSVTVRQGPHRDRPRGRILERCRTCPIDFRSYG